MPKTYRRKAAKDYPENGIKRGDMYFTASLKTGPRSSRTIRQLTPIKPSQLTTSEFLSGWLAAQEQLGEEGPIETDDLRAIADTIRELGEGAQERFENMPEGLQQGATGQMLENRAYEAESTAGELDRVADEIDAAEEPTEFDPADYAEEMSSMAPEDVAEFLSEKEMECEDEAGEFEQNLENLFDEARNLLDNAPE